MALIYISFWVTLATQGGISHHTVVKLKIQPSCTCLLIRVIYTQYLGKVVGLGLEMETGNESYLLSPKSPNPGMMYAFSLSPSSIHPVI